MNAAAEEFLITRILHAPDGTRHPGKSIFCYFL